MTRRGDGGHRRDELETLHGELVAFRRFSDDGWGTGVLRVAASGADPQPRDVTVVGKVLDARVGDALELSGTHTVHPRFGAQFKIVQCVTARATSAEGVARWLASSLPDVGAARARAMIEHFGSVEALWNVIETDHARLAEVNGITADRSAAIAAVYAEQRSSRDHMVALRGWGLTTNQIQKCLDEWETLDAVVEKIRANPYLLARHVHGFGFNRADEVARLAGVAHDAPERVEAGIVYTLEKAMNEGHVFLYGGALQKIAADDLLHVSRDAVAHGIVRATAHRMIVRRGKRCYSARMEACEGSCAYALGRIMSGRAGGGEQVDDVEGVEGDAYGDVEVEDFALLPEPEPTTVH